MENFSNPHMEKWAEYTRKMSEAMQNNDIEAADKFQALAQEAYHEYKEFANKMYSCNGFEQCNQAIQESLTHLVKENTSAVKNIMKLMKEDKNLAAQFSFYNSLNNCTTDDVANYITEALSLVSDKIDYKTIKESNNKLINLVRKYGIVPEQKFSNEKIQMFEDCDYLLTHKKKISNLNEYSERLKNVTKYIETNVKPLNESKTNVFKLIEDYDKKYANLLNEDERAFVKEITDFKKGVNTSRKNKFFENLKSECLNGVSKLLENCNESEKNDLIAIKEEIKNKQFCEETLVKDIAKLLELRDVILDK